MSVSLLENVNCFVNLGFSWNLTDRYFFHVITTCKEDTHQVQISFCWFFPPGATAPSGPRPPHYRGFSITLRRTTFGRTPPNEWSARRRDLYLTIHNTHKRQTSMPPSGFEPTILASERSHTHSLDRAATGIGIVLVYKFIKWKN
jgi:hypothetical protein